MSSHHGKSPDNVLKFGPTKEFPEGKIRPDDDGGLTFGIAADVEQKKVVMDFGIAVKWLGMSEEQARTVAAVLINAANEIRDRSQTKEQT